MSNVYKIPDEYFFRLHHVRPRFKNNVEEVLLYVSTSISDLPKLPKKEFDENLNQVLFNFGRNKTATQKTIDNWRTEISALFAFIQEQGKIQYSGKMARRLAESQYLDEFFNYFLYSFQYPAGHIANYNVIAQIKKGIRFKPCKFILELFQEGTKLQGKEFSLTAEELTFCAYFDLRVTAGKRTAKEVAQLILDNRQSAVEYTHKYEQLKTNKGKYPSKGDTTRYAGDILDYMVLADLLKTKGTGYYYFLNEDNKIQIQKHLDNQEWCDLYDEFYGKMDISKLAIRDLEKDWFDYVNSFENIDEFLPRLDERESADISALVQEYYARIQGRKDLPMKIFGDYGETLILAHEYLRTKESSNRQHLINKIPTPLGVGYDLQSIEVEKNKRYIEVKTTKSKKALNNNRFKLTPNEWDSAETLKDRYFIYYLVINETSKNVFVIQNPVEQYRLGNLTVDKNFTVEFSANAGQWQQLLEVIC
ncbi:protein NO VEIN domain-containing protein [Ursidibacter arcticus]